MSIFEKNDIKITSYANKTDKFFFKSNFKINKFHALKS